MKKILRPLLCVLLLAAMLTLAACNQQVGGKYTVCRMESFGMIMEGAALDEGLASMDCTRADVYVEFRNDGTGTLSMGPEEDLIQFQYDGSQLWTAEEPDKKIDYSSSDSTVTIEIAGTTLTFTK